MLRRKLLAAGVSLPVAGVSPSRGQTAPVPRIGVLVNGTEDTSQLFLAALRDGLKQFGYADDRAVILVLRGADGRLERLPSLLAELVALKVDVIVAAGGPASLAARQGAGAIPVVFLAPDPVELGLAASFSRPGGNATGLSLSTPELTPKRLEILRELLPRAATIAFLMRPASPTAALQLAGMRSATEALAFRLQVLAAEDTAEIEQAFAEMARQRPDALLVAADALFTTQRKQIVALAGRHAIPAMYEFADNTELGGLVSYGPSLREFAYVLGIYTGRILRGARPADLPVQQPTKFELVINLRTAKALGLTVPETLVQRADAVIE